MALSPRKMIAMDEGDLQVVSAHCQDAVLKIGDIRYFPAEQRLLLELNRFKWEHGEKQNIRVKSVLHFERVIKVAAQGIDPKKKGQVLALLAIIFTVSDSPAGHIDLVFSGNAVVRLDIECIEAQLTDMNAAWEASSKPDHPEI